MKPAMVFFLLGAAVLRAQPGPLPVRGLHVSAPKPDEVAQAVEFISKTLPKEGVNVLVMEFNYRYQFRKRPEVVEKDALTEQDVRQLATACRQAGVQFIPQINLLGHQSWSATTFGLLRAHPEFDETPGRYPGNRDIYCRSYCPLHPGVHAVVFDLIDELMEVSGAGVFHAGMDEVFLLGEDDCTRCRGKNKAELFAGEVRAVRDHLAKSGRTLWMWADRFLDGEVTGIGKWEASLNATAPALDMIPKDVVLCDWHYERPLPTASYFAMRGFPVISSPWRKPSVALGQLEQIRSMRRTAPAALLNRMLGVLQTTWCGMGPFMRAYNGDPKAGIPAIEAARCFRELFEELRRSDRL